jgi:hypothetical protein
MMFSCWLQFTMSKPWPLAYSVTAAYSNLGEYAFDSGVILAF